MFTAKEVLGMERELLLLLEYDLELTPNEISRYALTFVPWITCFASPWNGRGVQAMHLVYNPSSYRR